MNMFEIVKRFMTKEPVMFLRMKRIDHNYDNKIVSPFHIEGSVWTHTMCVCTVAQHYDYPIEVKFAALLHDIGKAFTRSENKKTDGHVRVSFTGHDGVSFYRVVDVLRHYDDVLTQEQRTTIEKLVAMHSTLYSWGQGSSIESEFAGDGKFLELLSKLAHCDAAGRIALDPSPTDAFISQYKNVELNENPYKVKMMSDDYDVNSPVLTLLVGPPCCGKSSYVVENVSGLVISRDDIVHELSGLENYSEAWDAVDHGAVDAVLNDRFQRAINSKEDVTIDMTNVVRKRRRRFVRPARQKGYITRAVVFHVGHTVMETRHDTRARLTGKNVPGRARDSMEQGFLYPTYDDFDIIDVVR